MFLYSLIEGILIGAYLDLVLGSVALVAVYLRITRGWRWAIPVVLGGVAAHILMAVCVVVIGSYIVGRFTALQFLHTHLFQGISLIIIGLVLTLFPPSLQTKGVEDGAPKISVAVLIFLSALSGVLILPGDWGQVSYCFLTWGIAPGYQGVLLGGYIAGILPLWLISIEFLSYCVRMGQKIGQKFIGNILRWVGLACASAGCVWLFL